jgi:hypothetical protein
MSDISLLTISRLYSLIYFIPKDLIKLIYVYYLHSVDCWNSIEGQWFDSAIVDMSIDGKLVKIHYKSIKSEFDEWKNLGEQITRGTLTQSNTHCCTWNFDINTTVLIYEPPYYRNKVTAKIIKKECIIKKGKLHRLQQAQDEDNMVFYNYTLQYGKEYIMAEYGTDIILGAVEN